MENVIYIKYNKLRKPSFRISTMICENGKKKYVVKKALTEAAENQIETIYKNSLKIGSAYENLDILLPKYEKDRVVFEFLEGKNLESCLVEVLDDQELLTEKILQSLNIITGIRSEYRGRFRVTEAYREVFKDFFPEGEEEASNYTNIDMLFDNIILKDGHYICLDCEWVFDFPIPIKFVKYRSLFYFYQKYEAYLKKWVDLEHFLGIFEITSSEKKVFMEMERNFQMYVTGQDFENDYVYKYEKECPTLEEAFVDRKSTEQKIQQLEVTIKEFSTNFDDLQVRFQKSLQDLEGKYAHVEHLESVVVEKSHEIDRLNREMALKEQHVRNLSYELDSIHASKWFKAQNKLTHLKKGSHKK